MTDRQPIGAITRRVRRPRGPGSGWALVLVLLVAALPRLWRFEAVGEGTDEFGSVDATRALVEGRFSYRELNDFAVDAYQAKFCPVAEACAAPFVAVLGDRPLSFRLPSLLASLALCALLVRAASRRFGGTAAWLTAGLVALDYRSVYYAQTHRYVAIEQLLAFVLFLAVHRADRTRRLGYALAVILVGLALVHTHLIAVTTIGALALGSLLAAGVGRQSPRRFPKALLAHAILLVYGAAVWLAYRAVAPDHLFEAGTGIEAWRRAAFGTVRMLGGQGLVAGTLGVLGAVGLLRRATGAKRTLALAALVPLVAFAIGSLRVPLRPRYMLVAQPFLWLAAGAYFAHAIDRLRTGRFEPMVRGRRAVVLGVVLVVASAVPTITYLASGGARDTEASIIEILRARATPGEGVMYDDELFDPFGRRPSDLPDVPRGLAWDPNGERAIDEQGVRWIVRSSLGPDRPLYTPSFLRRLLPVGAVRGMRMFEAPAVLTLYRVRPR